MAIFREPTYTEILLSYIYHYVILATVFSLGFVYYLFRTRAPLKEEDESAELARDDRHGAHGGKDKAYYYENGPAASAVMANGNLEAAKGDQELLQTILHGMELADVVAADDEAEEKQDGGHKVARSRKVGGNLETPAHVEHSV